MMQVIGIKRLIILIILVSLNLTLGAAIYLYLMPENNSSDRQLRTLRAQTHAVRADIDRMQIEFEQLEKQRDSFNALKDDGFFSNQVRSDAKKLFSVIQDESGVVSAIVSVKSGVIIDYDEAKKANHSVLMSPIEVEIKALDDTAIYKYMDTALERFPGHLSFDNIVITRTRDISAPVLRAIASGATPELVKAKINMSWRTLIPTSEVISNDKGL